GSSARLLGALSSATTVERLVADPALPGATPLTVLDDLIDVGRFPAAWLSAASSTETQSYLRARTAIDTLDDAQLAGLGAHEERARRHVRQGAALPADLPHEVAARFAPLRAALGGDEDALLQVASAAGFDAGSLRAALA